jgi:hypothetical protein
MQITLVLNDEWLVTAQDHTGVPGLLRVPRRRSALK